MYCSELGVTPVPPQLCGNLSQTLNRVEGSSLPLYMGQTKIPKKISRLLLPFLYLPAMQEVPWKCLSVGHGASFWSLSWQRQQCCRQACSCLAGLAASATKACSVGPCSMWPQNSVTGAREGCLSDPTSHTQTSRRGWWDCLLSWSEHHGRTADSQLQKNDSFGC